MLKPPGKLALSLSYLRHTIVSPFSFSILHLIAKSTWHVEFAVDRSSCARWRRQFQRAMTETSKESFEKLSSDDKIFYTYFLLILKFDPYEAFFYFSEFEIDQC